MAGYRPRACRLPPQGLKGWQDIGWEHATSRRQGTPKTCTAHGNVWKKSRRIILNPGGSTCAPGTTLRGIVLYTSKRHARNTEGMEEDRGQIGAQREHTTSIWTIKCTCPKKLEHTTPIWRITRQEGIIVRTFLCSRHAIRMAQMSKCAHLTNFLAMLRPQS